MFSRAGNHRNDLDQSQILENVNSRIYSENITMREKAFTLVFIKQYIS